MLNKLVPLAAVLLAACAQPDQPPLAGSSIGGPFTLQTAGGAQVSDTDLEGRWRIMYFGFTNCPDVCPTDMAALGQGLAEFRKGEPDKKVALVFVTVDPERDTPAVAAQFARNFAPDAIGLSGSPAAIDGVKKSFAIYSRKAPGGTPGSYLVDHSRTAYLMDPDGKPVALLPSDEGGKAVAAALDKWVT